MQSEIRQHVEGVRKIVVVRANELGDLICALPAYEALKATYPQAELVLLAKEWHAQFLAERPGPVDRVIVVPPYPGVGVAYDYVVDDGQLARFFAAMQQEKFDIAFQMHGGGRNSNPFVLKLGARLTVGAKTPDALALDRTVPYYLYQPEILRLLELVSLVGASPISVEPRLAVTQADIAASFDIVPDTDKPLLVMHPGATDGRRRWPAEKFAAVGDALAAAGAHVVITGMAWEAEIIEAVANGMRAPAQNLCNRLSLSALTGLLSRCQVLVTNDSGPVHLAAAVGAASVGIFWCGNMLNYGPVTRRLQRPVIAWRLNCPICGVDCTRESCEHLASFVADVPVDEVLNLALELLARAPSLVR